MATIRRHKTFQYLLISSEISLNKLMSYEQHSSPQKFELLFVVKYQHPN